MKTHIVISFIILGVSSANSLCNNIRKKKIQSTYMQIDQSDGYSLRDRNKGGIVSQNHLKFLFENDWIFNKYDIKVKNMEGHYESICHEDSLYSGRVFTFNDSIITLSDETIGFLDVKFINHIDTIRIYGVTKYNVNRYSLSLDFLNNESVLSGSFSIASISEIILNIEQERTNKETGENEIINIIFHAQGKEEQIRDLYENSILDDIFN